MGCGVLEVLGGPPSEAIITVIEDTVEGSTVSKGREYRANGTYHLSEGKLPDILRE